MATMQTHRFARGKATSALSYLSSRVVLIVKVPSTLASPVGTFFTWGAATLDLLLLEHSSASSTVSCTWRRHASRNPCRRSYNPFSFLCFPWWELLPPQPLLRLHPNTSCPRI